ncbi:MAG: hypothetical protein ACOC23_04915 [Thermodesulfobacteriota bacterium]
MTDSEKTDPRTACKKGTTMEQQAVADLPIQFFANEAEWKQLREILDRPAKANPGIQRLMKEIPPWAGE